MDSMGERLAWARERAEYRSARAAALTNGWKEVTYRSHEKGTREFDMQAARRYGRVFHVDPVWLLHGVGQPDRSGVPIVGRAGAGPEGSILFSEAQGEMGEAEMPPGGNEKTVAVEVDGTSMRGIAEDGWLVYYEDRRDPPSEDLYGELCVIGLADGRVLIKYLHRGRRKRHFDLESAAAPVLRDVHVEWAAPVTAIIPRRQARRLIRAA